MILKGSKREIPTYLLNLTFKIYRTEKKNVEQSLLSEETTLQYRLRPEHPSFNK